MNGRSIDCPENHYSWGCLGQQIVMRGEGKIKYTLKQLFTFARASESRAPTAAPTGRQVMWRAAAACIWETGSFQQRQVQLHFPTLSFKESSRTVSPLLAGCTLQLSLPLVWSSLWHLRLPLTPEKSRTTLFLH